MSTAPGKLPLAGHALTFMFRPLEFLKKLPSTGDIVKLKLGSGEVYVPCNITLFRQVLKEAQIFDKGGVFYDRGRETVGNSLVTCNWDDHQQQRPLMQPSFDHKHISSYAQLIADEVNAMTSTWRPGDVVDINRAMGTLTLRITARALFSVPADHRSVSQVERWLPTVMAGFYRRMVIPASVLWFFPTKLNRQYRRSIVEMRKVAEDFVNEARAKEGEHTGLLATILNARDEKTGEPLGTQEVLDQAIAILIAGSETTAKSLGFIFDLLGRHADVATRLRDEVDGALGGRTPRFEDVSSLPYTRQVIMEALRIYPPGWIFSRATASTCVLGGHEFPAGSIFVLSPYIMHHNPELFPNPETFDPDRWGPGGMSAESRKSVLPFGFGAHKCIGDQFALTEAIMAIAMIVGRWDLSPVHGRPHRPVPRGTLGPGRLPMRLQERRPEPVQATTTAEVGRS